MIISAIESDAPSFRLLLGSDAAAFAEKMWKLQREEYDKWKNFSCQSDFT